MSVRTDRGPWLDPSPGGRASSPDLAQRRRASAWAFAAALLAVVASVAGLSMDAVYAGEDSTAAMLRGYDVVTLMVAPALAVAAALVRRGSDRAQLVSAALAAYLVYTYAYYLFGTGFNDLFLLHAAVTATSVMALVLQLTSLDIQAFAAEVRPPRARKRWAAVVLGVLAVALGGMWTYFAVHNAITGDIPPGSRLVESGTVVHLGMALDLVLLVPLYGAAALLLWRRSPWGHVLGAIAVLAGLLHQVSYVVAMPVQVASGVPGAVSFDPGEPVVIALYVLAGALLFSPMKTPNTSSTPNTGGEGRVR